MKMKLNSNNIIVAFIFLYSITPWYIAFGPFNLVNIISACFLVWWLVYAALDRRLMVWKGTSRCFWLYLIMYSLQALADTTLTRSIAYITSQLMVCTIIYSEVRKRDIFEKVVDALVYAGAFLCVTGLVEEAFHVNIFHIVSGLDASIFYTETRLGIYRIQASFSHPIVYCTYLCFIAALTIYRLNHLQDQKKIRLFKVIYGLVIINALFTMSRFPLVILFVEQIILGHRAGMTKLSKKRSLITVGCVTAVGIASAANAKGVQVLKNIGYMFLSLFNDNYNASYTMAFGSNEDAVGNRLDLYRWVADSVTGHELFGMGTSTSFEYQVHAIEPTWNIAYVWTKSSIENEYLYNYYIHGAVGLILFVLCIIGSIMYAFKVERKRKKNRVSVYKEQELTFSYIMIIVLLGYAITLLSVRASDNVRIFNMLMCILFGYYFDIKMKNRRKNNDETGSKCWTL